ncbi:MAG TPA: acyl-phosphate glycerol 3-phosphate acyltransferase [Nitrospiraceae bacterium]|nr:acyl-phosphate glycerol 3-phosphate acyltransferase [Nitrospiraceae bacterium]
MYLIIVVIASAYLIGAIPFGLLFSKMFLGIDVRSVGSGNIGATNVLRAGGKTAALLTLLADGLKGALPVLAVRYLFPAEHLIAVAGAAAVIGHNFPVYLGFKGGKGAATGFGVILAVSPLIGVICLLTWLGAALLWKYSSLAALTAFAAYPALTFSLAPDSNPLSSLSLFIAGLIYIRHRENIKRLLAGKEPKIGEK